MCQCTNSISLVLSNSTTKAGMVIQSECGCWKCPGCGEDLRLRWTDFALMVFASWSMGEYVVASPAQFTALTRRLRKADKLYFRIRIGQVSHVFHQPLVTTTQRYTPDPSRWLNPVQLSALFKTIIQGDGISRVSCSRALVKLKPAPVKTDWKRVAVTKRTPNQLTQWLAGMLIDYPIAHAKAFDGRLLEVITLQGFPVFDPPLRLDPRLTLKAAGGVDGTRKTRTERPVDVAAEAAETSFDDIRTALLVT